MNVNLLQSWLYRKAREHGLQIFHKTETGPTYVWGGSLPPTSCASRALNGLWLCFTWSILISPSHPIPRTVAFLQLTRCRSNDPDLLYPICDKYATTFFFKNAHWSLDSLVLNRRPNHCLLAFAQSWWRSYFDTSISRALLLSFTRIYFPDRTIFSHATTVWNDLKLKTAWLHIPDDEEMQHYHCCDEFTPDSQWFGTPAIMLPIVYGKSKSNVPFVVGEFSTLRQKMRRDPAC